MHHYGPKKKKKKRNAPIGFFSSLFLIDVEIIVKDKKTLKLGCRIINNKNLNIFYIDLFIKDEIHFEKLKNDQY